MPKLSGTGSTKWTMRQRSEQVTCCQDPECSDGFRIMPLGSDANPGAGSRVEARGLIIRDCRHGLRGKNGSAQQQGTHKQQCTRWRDDENRAILCLRSDLSRVPASVPDNRVE